MQTRYGYDAFGNRVSKDEGTGHTLYRHNALNQLVAEIREGKDPVNKSFAYDKRGNLTRITENGQMTQQYVYGALNRLEEAVNQAGKAAKYQYNGLGHRIGKLEGSLPAARTEQMEEHLNPQSRIKAETEIGNWSRISYTIDLTREYHNLLERSEGDITQTYYWDGNVASYEENGQRNYYLQDELGSPLRIEDATGRTRESYGYGAFGEDLYGNQGEMQPFGYTGYQKDGVAGTYYAQAREYQADAGRFQGMDLIVGFVEIPFSMNRYSYCFNSPMNLIDLNGAWPQWLKDAGTAIKKWWNKHIYGEEIEYVGTLETGEDYGGIYASFSASNTVKSDKYTGGILKKTTYLDEMNNEVKTKWSINIPTYDLGGEKSLGIPISIGVFGGTDGIGIDASLGVDLIVPKAEVNASLALGGEGVAEANADIGVGILNDLVGCEAELPLSPSEKLKLGLFGKYAKDDIEVRMSQGVYLKMGVVYVVVPIVVGIFYFLYTGDAQTVTNMIQQYWNTVVSSGCIQ